jgi:hypothetical protein
VVFLALVLYVGLDFANPLMPGAVCFDAADSVDGVGRVPPSVAAPCAAADPVPEPAAGPTVRRANLRRAAWTATPRAAGAVAIPPRTPPTRDPGRTLSSDDDH